MQPCWDCTNAYVDHCCWIRDSEPVKGWDAEKTKRGYRIINCPNFNADIKESNEAEEMSVKEIEVKLKKPVGKLIIPNIAVMVKTRIVDLMEEYNMGTFVLANRSGISYDTLKSILKLKASSVNLKTIIAISHGFGMTASQFLDTPIFNYENFEL